jgi:hypothetical protein
MQADEAAFEKHYPVYAGMIMAGRFYMERIEAIAKFHEDFNARVNTLWQKTQDKIYATIRSLDGEGNQNIRNLLASYQEQLIEQHHKTVTLMTRFFDRSIGGLIEDDGPGIQGQDMGREFRVHKRQKSPSAGNPRAGKAKFNYTKNV